MYIVRRRLSTREGPPLPLGWVIILEVLVSIILIGRIRAGRLRFLRLMSFLKDIKTNKITSSRPSGHANSPVKTYAPFWSPPRSRTALMALIRWRLSVFVSAAFKFSSSQAVCCWSRLISWQKKAHRFPTNSSTSFALSGSWTSEKVRLTLRRLGWFPE